MPLRRYGVRNEYGLGKKELYKQGVEAEDPKAVLDGVVVSGLVGLLRQLGDLSQFAAEVFHGLQEQVAYTSSRSRKLVTRLQQVEASLPSLEKAILSQTSHIHFAYTPGSEWHPRIRNEQNHFVFDDLPHFIMDSYEECREPPRLQLLDRFDTGGPGSCLKRYSDPTFFRRASASSEVPNRDKCQRERKAHKIKKKRSSQRSARFPNGVSNANSSWRVQFSSQTGQGKSSLSHTGSTIDMTFKSDMGDQSDSLGSKECRDFVECVSRASTSKVADKTKDKESSAIDEDMLDTNGITYLNEPVSRHDFPHGPVTETTVPSSSNVTWDENLELMEQMGSNYEAEVEDDKHVPVTSFHLHDQELKPVTAESIDLVDDLSEHACTPKLTTDLQFPEATMNSKLMEPDGLDFLHEHELKPADSKGNQVEDLFGHRSSLESDADDCYTRTTMDEKFVELIGSSYLHEQEVKHFDRDSLDRVAVFSEHGSSLQSPDRQHPQKNSHGNLLEVIGVGCGIDEVQDLHETNFEDEHLVQASSVSFPQLMDTSKGENTLELIADDYYVEDFSDNKSGIGEVRYMFENNLENANKAAVKINAEYVGDSFPQVTDFIEVKDTHEMMSNGMFAGDPSHSNLGVGKPQCMLEANIDYEREVKTINGEYVGDTGTLSDGGNGVNVIEWHHHEDIDSETDNFVDALYTIESESESEFEGQVKKQVDLSASENKLEHNEARESEAEKTNHSEEEFEHHVRTYDHKPNIDDSEKLPAFESLANSDSLLNAQSSLDKSEVAADLKQHGSPWSTHEKSVQSTQASSLPNVSQSFDIRADPDDIRMQSAACVNLSTSENNLEQNEARESEAEKTNQSEEELEHHVRTYDDKPDIDDSEKLPAFVSLASSESLLNAQSSLDKSEVAADLKQHGSQWSIHEKSVWSTQASSLPNVSQSLDIRADPDDIRMQSAVCEIASRSQALSNEKAAFTPHAPHEVPFGTSSSCPVAFWTNGTLLGLQPSKPTVVSMSNSMNTAPVSNGDVVGDCTPKVNDPAIVLSSSVKDSGGGNCLESDGQDVESSKNISCHVLDKCDKYLDYVDRNVNDHSVNHGLGDIDVKFQPSTVPTGGDSKQALAGSVSLSEDRPSLISLLGRGLLTNGVRSSGSMCYDENNRISNALATNDFENRSQTADSHSVSLTDLNKKGQSPVGSPPPSPPLEHMKISFRPIDGLETSRLKLKYPEGLDQHDSTVDSFPSFQLVPEVTTLQHDMGSDSDDDTFCRSYPCMSEASLSHLSDSDSEQWESGGTSESTDHALYDGFHRMSSTESASSSPQHDETDQGSICVGSRSSKALHAMSAHISHLHILDTNNKVSYDKMEVCINPEADSSHLLERMRQLPPLPPVEWRVSKQLLDAVEDKIEPGPDSLNQSVDSKIIESAISYQTSVDPAKVSSRTQEPDKIANADKADELKFRGQNQENHVANGRTVDGGGDFLHQIRTKSFNLKRTETARTFYMPSAAASNKVTAILQKANAIRRAVGSDAEDDSWSDA